MTTMTRTGAGAVTILAGALLAGSMAAAQDAEVGPQVAELERSYEEALMAGDYGAVAALYAEDALYSPFFGGIVEGREGVQGFYEEAGLASADIRPVRSERVGEGLVLILGNVTATLKEEAGGDALEGEFVVLAQEGEDGLRIRSLTVFPLRQPPEAPAGE